MLSMLDLANLKKGDTIYLKKERVQNWLIVIIIA
jgi:hypothetical protein